MFKIRTKYRNYKTRFINFILNDHFLAHILESARFCFDSNAYESFYSAWMRTTTGVPYLFLQYVNGIVENIRTNIRSFADETPLSTVIENELSFK